MSRNRRWRIAGGVAGGVVGAAATGAAVGVAARRSRLASRRRRRPGDGLDGAAPPRAAELGLVPPGTACSVTAGDGVRLACEVIEPAGRRRAELTVVLVHGFALDRRGWHFQRATLAELPAPRTRVVLYDHRSHGDSERASRASCTIAALGEDLDAVLRTLAPDGPVVLVGHSMGGMVIMALAERYPELFGERVVGVALLSTSAGEVASSGLPSTFLSRRNPLIRAVGALAGWQPELVERVRRLGSDLIWGITRTFAYGDRGVEPWLVDLVHNMISANGVDALTDFVDTLNTHDRRAALPALANCQVLIVAGDADRLIPFRHSEVIAAELADARLLRLPGVGHMAMIEQPDVVDVALAELLGRAVRRGGVVRRLRGRT